ncbi:flotillin family protein [Arenibacterium halophilum]|uniref:Flotillin family protein n=1 Tax=Arenibacterium halophilum TaxID=2583821 RepID=A0ABY2X8J4_9RHOB|nr:flotillin domain-containing protein [Arenibacterium halophilum]MAY87305.1 flotillin family protein [Pseudooceanicola sp.]TMV12686.1 flotillin family protein [Arenibacterium halophilum]
MVWVLSLFVLAIVLAVAIWFLSRFYAKATLDTALVRTGFGGRRVVMDGACLALPILHQVQKVSMGTIRFGIARKGREALMTRDQLRADVEMEFELRVEATPEGIATAAQSLGYRVARGGEAVQDAIGGALIDAMQAAAAARSLTDVHLDRAGFSREVGESVATQARKLGLELVSASLLSVDQADFSQMNENNAFIAQGMRRLAELVADERKTRVAVETGTELAIRESRLAQVQRQLEIERTEREAQIAQREHLDRVEADAKSRAEQAAAKARMASEVGRIEAERAAKAAQVENDETLRRAEMAAILALEEARIANDIALSRKRAEESAAKAEEETARAQVLLASESVQAQKDRAVAERERETAKLRQLKDIELEDAKVKSEVDTLLARARAEAAASKTGADAEKARMEAEAAGRTALNGAENTLSEAVIRMRLEERKLDRLPEIMTQMMKPVEKIDSIRINHIGGLGGGGSSSEGGADGAFGSAMEQILGMAVRLPAMKQMGEEIGLDFDANLAGRTADYANRIKNKDPRRDGDDK